MLIKEFMGRLTLRYWIFSPFREPYLGYLLLQSFFSLLNHWEWGNFDNSEVIPYFVMNKSRSEQHLF